MSEKFKYIDIKIDGKVKISPSGFGSFYHNPLAWYKTHISKEKKVDPNENMVLGTIIHQRLHDYYTTGRIDIDSEWDYMEQYKDLVSINEWKIADDISRIWSELELWLPTTTKPDSMEQQVVFEIPDSKYFIAGSYDYLRGTTIGDYKTTSTTPKTIKLSHKIQLYLYAIALRLNKIPINEIEVVYIVKLKGKPKVVVLNEPIDETFLLYVKQQVKDLIKRLDLVENNPDLLEIIFFENRDSYIH